MLLAGRKKEVQRGAKFTAQFLGRISVEIGTAAQALNPPEAQPIVPAIQDASIGRLRSRRSLPLRDALVERIAEHCIVSMSIRRYVVPLIYIKQKGFFDRAAHYHFGMRL